MTIFGVACIIGAIFISVAVKETNAIVLDDVGLDEQSKIAQARARANSIY